MKRTLLLMLVLTCMSAADVLTVNPAGTVTIAGSAPPSATTIEVQLGGGQINAGGTITAGDVVIQRAGQASGSQAVRGDDPRLRGAIPFWGAISNSARISIVSSGPATLNRLHVITGTSANFDIAIGGLSPAIGDVVGFYVGNYSAANKEYRLDAGGSVKIAGRSRYLALVHTNVVLLMWDGIDWIPLVLNLDTPWINAGPITVTATTTNPTKGTTSQDSIAWRRIGSDIEIDIKYYQSTAGTVGNGVYLLTVPIGTIDTALNIASTATVNADTDRGAHGFWGGVISVPSTDAIVTAAPYDSTRFRFAFIGTGYWGNAVRGFNYAGLRVRTKTSFAMNNW